MQKLNGCCEGASRLMCLSGFACRKGWREGQEGDDDGENGWRRKRSCESSWISNSQRAKPDLRRSASNRDSALRVDCHSNLRQTHLPISNRQSWRNSKAVAREADPLLILNSTTERRQAAHLPILTIFDLSGFLCCNSSARRPIRRSLIGGQASVPVGFLSFNSEIKFMRPNTL